MVRVKNWDVLFSCVLKCVQGRLQRRLKQTGRACFDQRAFIVKRITFFYLLLFVLFCYFTLLTFLISCEFKHPCILGFFPLPSLLFFCFSVFLFFFLVSFLFLQFVFSFLVRSNKHYNITKVNRALWLVSQPLPFALGCTSRNWASAVKFR